MKILVQWTKNNVEGWREFDLRDTPQLRRLWERLPKLPEPAPGQTQTGDTEGWIFDINIQGIYFGGADHYAVELVTNDPRGFGLRVTTWSDDLDDPQTLGNRTATEWTLFDPAPDPVFGGAINTRQFRRFWAENLIRYPDAIPFAQFTPPADAITRHGIWVSDQKVQEHLAARGPLRGWREWIV